MEEQTASNPQIENTSPESNEQRTSTADEKNPKGKTGLLAAALIILIVLLGLGFIFFRQTPQISDDTKKIATSSSSQVSNQEIQSASVDASSDLKELDQLNSDLTKIDTKNDNEPSY